MLHITQIPALTDNYMHLIHNDVSREVAVVDPSVAASLLEFLRKNNLRLTHILNTHHHFDHTGGNTMLKEETGCAIIGSEEDKERIPGITQGVNEGDAIEICGAKATILSIPGHTKGHIAFYFSRAGIVFTGDTLFSLGCGRLFEGTAEEMYHSLAKLALLPQDTNIYCGHEYTEANGAFAISMEPSNEDLLEWLKKTRAKRANGESSLPSTIGIERLANPFLRAHTLTIQKALQMEGADPVEVFAVLRRRKDNFKRE